MSDNTTQEYAFARKSKVANAGADLKNSARHKANEWRSLAEAEADGSAEAAVTRDQLLRNEPPSFLETMTPENALSVYTAWLILRMLPAVPCNIEYYHSRYSRYGKKTLPELRKQFYDVYSDLKRLLEEAVDNDSLQLMSRSETWASERIKSLRQGDTYNPIANALVSFIKRVRPRGQHSLGVKAKLVSLFEALKGKSLDALEDQHSVYEYIVELVRGKSINKVFELEVKEKPTYFDETKQYVLDIKREGGRTFETYDQQAILDRFGLRGLQFGNYVPDKERLEHLQHAAEALADLADVIQLPDKEIAIVMNNRSLGLAVGARGSHKALAHYEPTEHVINLTRKSGIGSLAHEWWHGFDKLLGQQYPENRTSYLSQAARRYGASKGEEQPLLSAMADLVVEELTACGLYNRLYGVTTRMVREGTMRRAKVDYWLSVEEITARTFEQYVLFALRKNGRCNTYLSGNKGHELWPTADEITAVTPKIEKLFQVYREANAKTV